MTITPVAFANLATVTRSGVTLIPAFSSYRDGERIDMLIGASPKLYIAAKVKGQLA